MPVSAAALRLQQMGARNVVITGGHLDPPWDLISPEKGKNFVFLEGRKIISRSTHGTGCAFSTAVACNLANDKPLVQAATAAKKYVESALRNPPAIGKGIGPII
jgi:hydroxymethylpyrimidine/phosphomethylpyrimidine kinase